VCDKAEGAPAKLTVRAELRLRNGAVIEARQQRGWSQRKLAEEAGVSLPAVQAIEWLDFSRLHGEDEALKIAVRLELDPEALLPADLKGMKLASKVVASRQVNNEQLLDCHERFQARFALPAPDVASDVTELRERLYDMLGTLTYREREVIKSHYGLSGPALTLAEVSKKFFVTPEYARVLKAKALRKLQHPTRTRALEVFVAPTKE
jgi:transcriptional regulator with XRE-family HTH domain